MQKLEDAPLPTVAQVEAWRQEARRRWPEFELVFTLRAHRGRWEYGLHLEGGRAWLDPPPWAATPHWQPLAALWRADHGDAVAELFERYPDQAALLVPTTPALPPPLAVLRHLFALMSS